MKHKLSSVRPHILRKDVTILIEPLTSEFVFPDIKASECTVKDRKLYMGITDVAGVY